MAKKTTSAKKRNVKVDAQGQLHVHSSFNNIIVSLANSEGQVISWSSAGKMGFRGSKKNTPYAAQMAAETAAPQETAAKNNAAARIRSTVWRYRSLRSSSPVGIFSTQEAANSSAPPKSAQTAA